MKTTTQLIGYGTALLILFSSCKKDVTSPLEVSQADIISSNLTTEDEVIESAAPVLTPVVTTVSADCAGYYELLPARYQLTTKSYPFILFIHGIGELGTDVTRLSCCGIPYWANKKAFPADFVVDGQHFSYIVMAPQFKVRPTAAEVQGCIDYAVAKYRIDRTRIYISGLSMGGGSTWDYSAVYGQNVAAAVPVCGGTAPTAALAAKVASKNLPIWTISSKADQLVPISWATNWVAWINADNPFNKANVHLTTYTTEDHNGTWNKAFSPATTENGINIYEWMLRYKRSGAGNVAAGPIPVSGTVLVNAGADITLDKAWNFAPLLNGTSSTVSGGWFTKWAWTKIAGPASYKLADASAAQTRVSGLDAGTYTFRITATTNTGVVGSDEVNIIVRGTAGTTSTSTNSTVKINAGADATIDKAWNFAPLLNGTSSTVSGGWFTKWAWTKIAGPASYKLADASAAQTRVSGLDVGTYTFRITATTNAGAVGSDDVNIIVRGTAGTTSTSTNSTVKINAGADATIDKAWNFAPLLNGTSSTVSGGWFTKWAWTKIAGPASYKLADASAAQTRVSGLDVGTYTFRVTATTNAGVVGSDDVNIIVRGTAGTTSTSTNSTVKINAGADATIDKAWNFAPLLNGTSSTVSGGWFTKWAWTKIAGPASYKLADASAAQTRVSGLDAGTYTFRVTATTNAGVVGSDDVNITVLP